MGAHVRGNAVIWSGEDDPKDTLVPRLMAANADLSRVHFVVDAIGPDGPRPFDPARDMPLLQSQVERLGDVRLIVVDPIVSAVAGDSHKNAEVRRGLQPLVDLASKIGACLVGITHFTKGTSGRDTTERVTGSTSVCRPCTCCPGNGQGSHLGGLSADPFEVEYRTRWGRVSLQPRTGRHR